MAIETDLTVSPYFESDQEENYYKVLFKPSVPVQVRELNQLQKMLQDQIEKFGDNILKRGTIVKGCRFNFYNNYPYIKIRDTETNGAEAILSRYDGKIIENSSGVKAYIQGYDEGFEANDPDLKTLYVRYNQSGTLGSTDVFSAGDILTVTNPARSIYGIDINSGGTGYSNNDTFLLLSALVISDTEANGFASGHTIIQQTTNAQATIIEVNTSIYANRTILKIAPLSSDLTTANTSAWDFRSEPTDYDIRDTTSNSYAEVLSIIGSQANVSVVTDSTGKVTSFSINNPGTGYFVAPQVGVISSTGSGANVQAENYLAKITIASVANAVGSGYAFGVSDGVIYQKGYFVNVDRQHVIVSKYDPTPNNLSVGFRTAEEIIDANEDTNLLDNALGTPNYTAPGADRLKLTPELIVVDSRDADANSDFFAIVEFSEGIPYKQNQQTEYSVINNEMSKRTFEQSGNFVLDRFDVATAPVANQQLDSQKFNIVIDPGLAYIQGRRVNTLGNYTQTRNKGIDIGQSNVNMSTGLDYGNYVAINNLLGAFPTTKGGTVELHSVAKNAYSNIAMIEAGTISSPGAKIGEARVRSIQYIDGYPGSASAKYYLYLFDIEMQSGEKFKDVRSVYDGTGIKGVADIITESTRSYANGDPIFEAVLKGTKSSTGESKSKLLFNASVESPLSINSFSYNYLKSGNTEIANTGNVKITLTGSEYFITSGQLSDSTARDFIFVPQDDLQANITISGTVISNTSTANVIGTSTTFLSDLREGDYVLVSANSTGGTNTRRVTNIVNNTFMQLDSVPTVANAVATIYRVFPKNVPLPFGYRNGMVLTVNSDARVLDAYIGTRTLDSSNVVIDATYPVMSVNTAPSQKTPLRNRYVKICVANNGTGFKLAGYGTNKFVATTNGSNTATGSTLSSVFTAGDSVIIEAASGVTWTSGNFKKPSFTVVSANASHIVFDQAINFTSANVTIRKAGNLEGPWCLGVPDIFRLRSVYHSGNSTINTASNDVTRHFYIDHNQTGNFYGLGYLYKYNSSNFIVRPGDYLLIEYDCFSTTGTFHHINSYVESNSELRFATDVKPLANLTSTAMDVNTLEIPVVKTGKRVHDLINQLDFRPYATKTANTSVVSATDANITINPSDTIAFDSTDKKFPVPGSLAEYNTTGFLARIDSVYVNKENEFGVKRGDPKPTLKEAVAPELNSQVMVLANLLIPAYPNVTQMVSNNTSKIIDTNVVNETLLRDRLSQKAIIRENLSTLTLDTYQPYRYTMADIGNLERRIKDLEYNVALTLVELDIKDKKIPSNVDPTIDRFKFGFFTDNFDDYNLAETQSQEFNAEILGSRVLPPYDRILIDGDPDSVGGCDCTPFLIVAQNIATGDAVNSVNVINQIKYSQQKNMNEKGNGTSAKWYTQNTEVVFASELPSNYNDTVKLYTYNYGAFDRHEIRQSTEEDGNYVLVASSSDARAFTNAEAKFAVNNGISTSLLGSNNEALKKFESNGSFTKYGAVIEFSHNPANGRYYRITSKKGNDSNIWNWILEYPINGNEDPNDKDPCSTPAPQKYTADLEILKAKVVNVVGKLDNTNQIPDELRTIKLRATGLKASTKHKFYVNGKDQTTRCDTSVTSIPDEYDMKKDTYNEWLDLVGAGKNNIMTDDKGQSTFLLYLVDDPNVFTGKPEKVKETTKVDGIYMEVDKIGKGEYNYVEYQRLVTSTTFSKTGTYVFEIYNSDKSSRAQEKFKCAILYQSSTISKGVRTGGGGGSGDISSILDPNTKYTIKYV